MSDQSETESFAAENARIANERAEIIMDQRGEIRRLLRICDELRRRLAFYEHDDKEIIGG